MVSDIPNKTQILTNRICFPSQVRWWGGAYLFGALFTESVSVTGASRRDPVIKNFFLNMTWDIPSPVCEHWDKSLLSLSGIEPRFLRQRVHYTVYAIPAVDIISLCISVRLFTGILQLLHRAHTVLFLLQMHRHLLTFSMHCFVNCFPREFL